MKPILFNTEMVRAILEGRKTVTRRVVKPQPWDSVFCDGHEFIPDDFGGYKPTGFICEKCGQGVCPPYSKYPVGEALFRPYCWPDDILYVRETWAYGYIDTTDFECRCNECFFEELKAGTQKDSFLMPRYFYRAEDLYGLKVRWRPSIHMPKEAARLFLRVNGVRVERLQDIDDDGVVAEGLKIGDDFDVLWDGTIKKADIPLYGWEANPWVWVIEFERCDKPEED